MYEIPFELNRGFYEVSVQLKEMQNCTVERQEEKSTQTSCRKVVEHGIHHHNRIVPNGINVAVLAGYQL
jgi:hypothetical protein